MTMLLQPNSFVKLVQKILVGNYEPIIGICRKIFIINLHHLQMLFMLRIKHKFSESLAPFHKHEAPNVKLSGYGSSQACRHGGGHSRALNPKSFLCPTKFCCAHKNL